MKLTKFLAALSCAVLAMATHAGAQIVVEGTGTSGNIAAVAGTDSGSFSFTNPVEGEFLVVTVAGEANANSVTNNYNPANITVSYNGNDFTLGAFGTNSNDGFAGVWYLTDPIADGDPHTMSFDFGGDIFDDGSWEFGVMSLSGVDELDPIAAIADSGGSVSDQNFNIAPGVGQTFNAGDFLALADANQAVTSTGPHFATTSGDQVNFFTENSGNGYSSIYQVLTGTDIVGGDIPIIDQNTGNKYQARGLVLNAAGVIPEPTSAAMLLGGATLLLLRRRRA